MMTKEEGVYVVSPILIGRVLRSCIHFTYESVLDWGGQDLSF
jgi:hypothetical protein